MQYTDTLTKFSSIQSLPQLKLSCKQTAASQSLLTLLCSTSIHPCFTSFHISTSGPIIFQLHQLISQAIPEKAVVVARNHRALIAAKGKEKQSQNGIKVIP